jgi:hypothetical protein
MTNVFCFAGACAFLFLKGKKLQSIIFFFATVATMLICVLVLNYLSQGRMIEAMKYCSTGGAVFWKGPVKMFKNIVAYDTSGLMVIISAIAAIMFLNLRKLTGILALTFIISGVATVMMFLSPGVDINHLLDLEVIAIILLASFAAEQTMPRKFILSILTVITVFASISTMAFWRNDEQSPARKEGLEAVELLKKRNHPLLIEDTALSVIAGQRPFLLDPFSLRLARMNNEEFDRDFIGKIRQQFFGAIILMGNPDTFRWWLGPMYETTHFGHGFTDVLKEYYIRDPRFSKSYIYIPRKFPEE